MIDISIQSQLEEICGGIFKGLFSVIQVRSGCLNCYYFNHTLPNTRQYKGNCNCAPSCIGMTLRTELISYMLWKIGVKTEQDHLNFLGV